jgi:serine/threonine-protein phosphatase PPG1
MLDLDAAIERCCAMELLDEDEVEQLCARLKEILMDAPNVSRISSPVTVVGDIHGQFQDLLELFRVGGPCPLTNFLFLGDYVDRGNHSVLTITLLACLNVRYPARMTLLVSTVLQCAVQ